MDNNLYNRGLFEKGIAAYLEQGIAAYLEQGIAAYLTIHAVFSDLPLSLAYLK